MLESKNIAFEDVSCQNPRRPISYTLLRDLPESVRSNTIYHTENGAMTRDDWLDTYERHIPEHIEQMRANCDDWVRQKGAGYPSDRLGQKGIPSCER